MSSLFEIEGCGKDDSYVERQPSLGAAEYRQRGAAANLARQRHFTGRYKRTGPVNTSKMVATDEYHTDVHLGQMDGSHDSER